MICVKKTRFSVNKFIYILHLVRFVALFFIENTYVGYHFVCDSVSNVNKRPIFLIFCCAPREIDIIGNIGLCVIIADLSK